MHIVLIICAILFWRFLGRECSDYASLS